MVKEKFRRVLSALLCVAVVASVAPKHAQAEDVVSENSMTADYGINNPTYDGQVATFDCVWFGKYMQKEDDESGKEPIKWRVLSVDGDKALLLADQNMGNQRFNDGWDWGVPWNSCTLRQWMNAEFKDAAFEENELSAICNHEETGDTVFALSKPEVDEMNQQFKNNGLNEDSIAGIWKSSNTDYLKKCLQNDGIGEPNTGWWLRSNGMFNFLAYYITDGGGQDFRNIDEQDEMGRTMARPSVYLDLSKTNCWSYAGTVSSDGTTDESVPRKFDYIRDTWNFENLSSKIPSSSYKMFDSMISKEINEDNLGTEGQCFGMCLSAATIYEDFPKIASFGQYSCLNEIGKNDYSDEVKCKAKEYIGYSFVYQYTKKYSDQLGEHSSDYEHLYEAINNFRYKNGTPVLILIGNLEGGTYNAHALLGIEVAEENENAVKILVYDCNYPNKECFLTLTKKNGALNGWSYDLLGWDDSKKDAGITYLTLSSDFINDYNTGYAEKNNATLLMKIQKKTTGLLKYGNVKETLENLINHKMDEISPIIVANGKNASNYNSYWLDNSKLINIDGLSKESEVRIANGNSSIALMNSNNSNAKIDMNNKEVTIESKDNIFNTSYEKSIDYENSKIFSVEGNENKNVNIKSTGENTWEILGVNRFSVAFKTKEYEDNGDSKTTTEREAELKDTNENSTYQIEASDTNIIIREDKDGDGVFEKRVIPTDTTGNDNPKQDIPDQDASKDNTENVRNDTVDKNNDSVKNTNISNGNKSEIKTSEVKSNIADTKKSESPDTGDHQNRILWFTMMIISAGIIIIAVYKKKHKRTK